MTSTCREQNVWYLLFQDSADWQNLRPHISTILPNYELRISGKKMTRGCQRLVTDESPLPLMGAKY